MRIGFYRLVHLNAWFPVGRTVREGLGGLGVVLLGEVCHCGVGFALRFQKPMPFLVSFLSALCLWIKMSALSYSSSSMPAYGALLPAVMAMNSYPLQPWAPN